MHKVYPDGRLIYILRDGRDAAISHRFQAFIDFPDQLSAPDLKIRADFIQQPEPYVSGQRSIFSEAGLRRAAEGWVRNLVETDRLGKELYGENYISLRYEDLLQDPWDELQRLWTFLSAAPGDSDLRLAVDTELLQNPDAEWQQQKARGIAQSLQKGKRGGWREILTLRDQQIFHAVAADVLQAWGYSLENA
jgi:hypothetical protein